MSHTDAMHRTAAENSPLHDAILHVAHAGHSIASLRAAIPATRGIERAESCNMMRAVDHYLAAAQTTPLADRELRLIQERLADTLTFAISLVDRDYTGGAGETFGKQLAAAIATRTKELVAEQGPQAVSKQSVTR